jgi:hypothetical protein
MSEQPTNDKSITLEQAKEAADCYLKNRYYDFETVVFSGHEVIDLNGVSVYRLYGGIRIKSRSALDLIGFKKKVDAYKFVLDLDALCGKVLNYEFQ